MLLDLVLSGAGATAVRQGAPAVRAAVRASYRVLIYTNERRREVLAACIGAGAAGIVHKVESLEALAEAVHRIADGEIVITQALIGLAEVIERRGAMPALTSPQREVLSARACGESFRSIAQRLFISKKTAEEHTAVVSTKFADYLQYHAPADLERHLVIAPGDVLDDPI